MDTVPVYVGLDYHQGGVQVCVMAADGRILGNRTVANEAEAIAEFVRRRGNRVTAAIEACTGSADLADELALVAGWDIRLAHPGFVARMKQTPDKTDWQDARVLADLVRVGYLPVVWLAPEPIRDLRRVVRYRHQLVAERRATKLRVRATLRDCRVKLPGNGWTRVWRTALAKAELPQQARWVIDRHLVRLEQLAAEIALTETRLAELVRDDPGVQQLLTERGIGLVTAATLRAEVGRFDRFRSGKQLARYCGLSPRNASSGQRQADAGLIKAGNPQLRAVLIETAHRLVRLEPRWVELAKNLRENGKSGSVRAAAVANRWVRGLFHRMRAAS
jgi:transposase